MTFRSILMGRGLWIEMQDAAAKVLHPLLLLIKVRGLEL